MSYERSNPQIKGYVRPEELAEKGVKAVLSGGDIGQHLTSEMFFSGDRLPGFSDTIEHPDGLVLVDTGMIDTTPAIEDDGEEWHPNPLPDELVSRVAVVVGTHLHFDHCGGNRLFPGIPIHVQRRELADAWTTTRCGSGSTFRVRLDLVRHEGCDVNERRNVGSAFDASFNIEIFSVPESGNPKSLRHS